MTNASVHGVLVLDKPKGPTSHDIVARLRRTLRTREIGHAGTLDPAATGVLVVTLGEATKLSAHLTLHDKAYVATVVFGRATATLDAEGETTAVAPISDALARALAAPQARDGVLERALDAERRRTEQVPPAFSAIKQQGRPVHERARRGEAVELAPREVSVRAIDVVGASADRLTVALSVSKGYYVRAFARDLGAALGVPAHLASLRRTASGPFTLDEAIAADAPEDALRRAVIPLPRAAARALPVAHLSPEGTVRARHGKRLGEHDFTSPPPRELSAWLAPDGSLVALGSEERPGELAVRRGFATVT